MSFALRKSTLGLECVSVAEHLPGMYKALNLILRTPLLKHHPLSASIFTLVSFSVAKGPHKETCLSEWILVVQYAFRLPEYMYTRFALK